ncbi:acyl-CoA thioesterase [Pendulispora albinea]|uniref:Acyl-CoA thioesterase FadM n=1 Tax=Pendulispora albinea TaxID=2741071 RepID=A0ABZ2LRC4_9BACT
MKRTIDFQLPADSCMFTPFQLQPRTLLSLTMSAWTRWLREHFVPLPLLMSRHLTSVVVGGIEIDYLEPLGFLESDLLDVRAGVRTRREGSTMEVTVDFQSEAKTVARTKLVLIFVRLEDTRSLAARPARLDPALLARFEADELTDERAPRKATALVREFETYHPACERRTPFTIHRHLCEVADQWSFIELPNLVALGREAIGLSPPGGLPSLRGGISRRILGVHAELHRAFFVFDSGVLVTKAYSTGSRLAFVHELRSATDDGPKHATVIEQLDASPFT